MNFWKKILIALLLPIFACTIFLDTSVSKNVELQQAEGNLSDTQRSAQSKKPANDLNNINSLISSYNDAVIKYNDILMHAGKPARSTVILMLPITQDAQYMAQELFMGFYCALQSDCKNPDICLSGDFSAVHETSESFVQLISNSSLPFSVVIKNDKGDAYEAINLAKEIVPDKETKALKASAPPSPIAIMIKNGKEGKYEAVNLDKQTVADKDNVDLKAVAPNVIAVVGHYMGMISTIASRIYSKKQFTIISPTSDGTMISRDNWFLQMLPKTDDTAELFMQFIEDSLYKNDKKKNDSFNLLICREKNLQAASAVLSFLGQMDIQRRRINDGIWHDKECDKDNNDHRCNYIHFTQCDLDTEPDTNPNKQPYDCRKKFRQGHYDGVVLLPAPNSELIKNALNMANIAACKHKQTPIFAHPTILTKALLQQWMDGQHSTCDFSIATISPSYVRKESSEYKNYIPWRSAMTYDTFMALSKASSLLDNKSTTPLYEQLYDKLTSQDFFYAEGFTGKASFYQKRTHNDIYFHQLDTNNELLEYSKTHICTGSVNPFISIDYKSDSKDMTIKRLTSDQYPGCEKNEENKQQTGNR